ncbi:MAG: hypothetical protein AAFR58_13660 [Cyanobacteria bacterium J06627_28]
MNYLSATKSLLGAGAMPFVSLAIATALIAATPSPSSAGIWGFSRHWAERTDVTYEDAEQALLDAAETRGQGSVVGNLYPAYEVVFESAAVEIPFRFTAEREGNREVTSSGTIYYSEGELVILTDRIGGDNFVTIEGNLYSWKTGETTGKILTRFTGDTVELIDYWIDPAVLMRYIYQDTQTTPEEFTVTEVGDELVYTYKAAPYGFLGVRVTAQAPFWMTAMLYSLECQQEICLTDDGSEFAAREVDPPTTLTAIPAEVQVLPEGVTFEESDWTADIFMTYL